MGELKPSKRILAYGPPGTGKPIGVAAAAAAIGAQLFTFNSLNLISSSERIDEAITRLFSIIDNSTAQHKVVYFKTIENCFPQNNANDSLKASIIFRDMLKKRPDLIFVASTSSPWNIDQQVLHLFEKQIYIPIGDFEVRKTYLIKKLKDMPHSLSLEDIDEIATRTEYFSFSDMKTLLKEATVKSIRRYGLEDFFRYSGDKIVPCSPDTPNCIQIPHELLEPTQVKGVPLEKEDFTEALERVHATTSRAEVESISQWGKSFGQMP